MEPEQLIVTHTIRGGLGLNPIAGGGFIDGPASHNLKFSGFERVTLTDSSGANAVLNGLASIDTFNGGTGDDESTGATGPIF